jgi:integrase
MEKIEAVTQEQWNSINPKNKKIVEEYISQSMQLSDYTLEQYTSALKIYFWYIHENNEDKNFYEIKARDYLGFQNYLSRRGLSSSAIKFKRSAISSLNNYVLLYYLDEYPNFRNYISKAVASPATNFVHEKEPPTIAEYEKLCVELERMELYQELAYLKFSFSTGARRNEVKQLLKEVVGYDPKISDVVVKNENGESEIKQSRSYITHPIRCKGKSKIGKVRNLQFDESTMNAIKKWLEIRGDDDCPYVFVGKHNEKYSQISESTFNAWNSKIFTKILGRRMHCHIWREARATTLTIEQGHNIKVAQKLLGHVSSQTTEIYVIEKNKEDSDEAFL